jgi:formate C-acetyltransferase
MNPIVKSIAKPIYYKAQDNALGKKSISLAFTYRKLLRKFNNNKEAGIFLAKNINKVYFTNTKINKGSQIRDLLQNVEIKIPDEGFIFFLDEFKNMSEDGHIIDNISVDY